MRVRDNIKSILAGTALVTVLAYSGMVMAAEAYSPFAPVGKTAAVKSAARPQSSYKNLISLDDAVPTEDKSPFAGSETQMEELDKLEPIVEHLRLAIDAHNVLNSLGNYRNIQKQYNHMVQLHDKSVEILKASEQCTIDYLGRYFNNPVKVWSGVNMAKDPANHDLRTGLSRWAIEMFEMAKSSQVSPVSAGDLANIDEASADSFAKINEVASKEEMTDEDAAIRTDVGRPETSEIKDLRATQDAAEKHAIAMHEKYDGKYLKEPSKEEELEKETRKIDLMANDIGSVVSVWLADYLAGKPATTDGSDGPAWTAADLGGIKKRFPVWNDQKTFYSQYLNRKYANIRDYVKNYDVPTNLRKRVSDAVFNRQKQFMTQAEADITQAAYKAVNTAQADRDAKVDAARQKYNSDVSAINSRESAEISSLASAKDGKIKNLDEKIKSAQDLRDEYAGQLSDINGDKQNLQSETEALRQEITRMETLLSGASLTDEQKAEYAQIKADATAQIAQIETRIKELDNQRLALETSISEQTDIINRHNQEKGDIENEYTIKVSDIKTASQTEISALTAALEKEIKKFDDEFAAKKVKIAAAEKAAKAALGSKSTVTAEQIIKEADIVFATAKDDAYRNIDETVAALKALEDDLYRGQVQNTVSSYHQALIDSLKGQKSTGAAIELEPVGAKVHDITNFLTDIVTGIDDEMATLNVSDYRSKVENTTVLLTVPVFDDMLKDIDTSADTQYFVGSTPKTEDFRAPMTMPDFNLPPLREYVRLDYVDLQSIAKDADKLTIGKYAHKTGLGILPELFWEKAEGVNPVAVVDKEKFLNYGGRIPEIWKLMLKDKAFVDSEFYLTKDMAPEGMDIAENPLQLGGEMSPLYRGGVYPCVIKDSNCGENVVVDVARRQETKGLNSNKYYKTEDKYGDTKVTDVYMTIFSPVIGERRTQLLAQGLPVCQEVTSKCSGKEIYLASLNHEEEKVSRGHNEIIKDGEYSELGSILGVYSGLVNGKEVKNVLAYTPEMQSVINYGLAMEKMNDPKNDGEPHKFSAGQQQNDDVYVRAQYNVNQVGDFLSHAETEQDYKNSLDEIEESLVKMKEDLYETLRTFGFEPSPDFDISKEADYELAVNKIKAIKKSNMAVAKSSIVSIEPGDSDLLYQSKNSYNRIYEGLATDKEAVTVMAMDVDNPTEFAEDVKTGTVNRDVDNEYEKKADESFEEQMKAFKPVYCAAY